MTCERCGEKLEVFRQASTQGLRCPNCDWSALTTQIPGVQVDETVYEVRCSGNYKNESHIRVVSEITSLNFLMSRKALQEGVFIVFSGRAREALRVRNVLSSVGLTYRVSPEFIWE